MKRSWFGIGLLAVLLVLTLLADWALARCHTPVAQDLEKASQSALAGDWPAADQLTQHAIAHWERCRPFSAAVGNQAALEQVDSLFARLKIWLNTQDTQTAALCAEIARQIADMRHTGAWWDLL